MMKRICTLGENNVRQPLIVVLWASMTLTALTAMPAGYLYLAKNIVVLFRADM